MKWMMPVAALVLLAVPAALPAQQAPRQLSEEDLARLRRGVEQNKTLSAQGAQQATAMRQQQELTRREEALAGEDDGYDGEEDMPQQNVAANVFDAFLGTLGSEMAKKQQEDAQRQRFLDNVRREAEAVERSRQRELERQRLADERARLARQAQQVAAGQQRAPTVGSTSGRGQPGFSGNNPGPVTNRPQAGNTQEDTLRANAAAERKRLAEQRARAERGDPQSSPSGRPQVAAAATGASPLTPASVSHAPKPTAAPEDHGPAKAWCQASNAGTFQCMGPLQNLLSWYPSLETALSQSGCPGGEGYRPTPGHGGSSFNCGRQLKVNDYRMPTYDPYRGGGKPVLVKAGQ